MNFCSECGSPLENGKCPKCNAVYNARNPDSGGPIPVMPTVTVPPVSPAPVNKKMKLCKYCGAEIATSTKKCPHCGGNNKKPIYRRFWFWFLVVIVFLAIIANKGKRTDKENRESIHSIESVSVTASQPVQIPTVKPTEEPQEITVAEEELPVEVLEEEPMEETAEDGLTPEWKEWLDSYEAFMNQYCDFMLAYDADTLDVDMLLEYTSLLAEYAEYTEKVDEVDEASLSQADYNYYIDVTARVNKRLIDVSYSMN